MRVFVTGATGFIGSAIVRDLRGVGHEVVGLARAPEKAAAVEADGGTVLIGTVQDTDILRRGIEAADAVIHTAFNHDFSTFAANCADDGRVIEAMGEMVAGSGKPLLVTSGLFGTDGVVFSETDSLPPSSVFPRAATEEAAQAARSRGANVISVRLPQVHDTTRAGLVTYVIATARQKGRAAYVGEGRNRWSAAHVLDVARLYRLALEEGGANATWHAAAEESVPMRAIMEIVGRRLGVPAVSISPQEAEDYFGWLSHFACRDAPVSSRMTREKLGWTPTGPGLIEDLDQPTQF